ncbi:MAG TPA: hypothetical protein V6C81_02175 [Planktothrix sp.]|jgi:ppGpp synthetase/RelA/SpoT-type nucleotidyltranferase
MRTVLQNFKEDFNHMKSDYAESELIEFSPTNRSYSCDVGIHRDTETLTTSLAVHIPQGLSNAEETWFINEFLLRMAHDFKRDEHEYSTNSFSKDIYLYCDGSYEEGIGAELANGFHVVRRGPHYCELKANLETLIDSFMNEYQTNFDVHQRVAEHVRAMAEKRLRERNILAWVSARAKEPTSLRNKLSQRSTPYERGKKYRQAADIYADIVDLAGIRVALYFPGDRLAAVAALIESFIQVAHPREFPRPDGPPRRQRFGGYRATHMRVQIPGHLVNAPEEQSYNAEIQIASVIMHAWAEVEHDLQYKRQEGVLSELEFEMLDQLNGLAMAGEVSLEQLKLARDNRLSRKKLQEGL